MQWFEMGYDRKNVADRIMQVGQVEPVCEGYSRTAFVIKELGTFCMLHRYDERKTYDPLRAASVAVDAPLYVLQLKYHAPGDRALVDARINIDHEHSVLVGSSEYTRLGVDDRPEHHDLREKIWNEAMAAADDALCAHARYLGNMLTGVTMLGKPPAQEPVAAQASLPAVA